jgi:hypothetical protein
MQQKKKNYSNTVFCSLSNIYGFRASSVENFPVRVHVFVIWLAELKAKPGANHANAHPMSDW